MVSDLKRLSPGEQLQGIPGRTWNSFVDTAERVSELNGPSGAIESSVFPGSVVISVKNNTGAVRTIGDVFEIGSLALNSDSQIVAGGNLPSTNWESVLAVAIEPAASSSICKCVVNGIAKVNVNVTDTSVLTADIVNGSAQLASHLAGRFRLLNEASSTGVSLEWCHINGNRQLVWTGVADEDITAGGTGDVEIDSNQEIVTASLDKMHGSEDISLGKEVAVRWFDEEGLWRILWAECEDAP